MRKKLFPICVLIIFLLLTVSASNAFGYSENYKNENDVIFDDTLEPLLAPTWYIKPNNYAQLVSWYQALESAYPNYLEIFKANQLYGTGTATGGYDLYYVRITNENLGLHKPEVLFLGSPHGDETVGTIGMYWFTDWLMRMAFTDEPCQEYSKDYLRWLIDNREIYFAVSHNPYGFDHGPQRYDGNGWDLNREADMDGPGWPAGGIWASVNGKTLRAFVDNHLIRVACDFHGGARMLLYPWGSTHSNIVGVSPISGKSYTYAPPDFYFFDASSLRVGSYMGSYGGTLNQNNIGTIPPTVGYSVKGGISPWGYGADVTKNPVEDPWVVGDYPGAGILWLSPEMSLTKNPAESTFGNDTIHRFGAEVRRFILHQTDLAQPYILWQPGTIQDNSEILPGTTVPLLWQVNGSLVVDHTYLQWGKDPDPINNPEFITEDYDEHAGNYYGGTGWDNANSGQTQGITYNENIYLTEPGDYYFVAKAQVDQIYANVLRPDVYNNNPYLRLVKERTNDSFYEELDGTDGKEIISGQTWWYSPIIHVRVIGGPPETPEKPSGPTRCKIGVEYIYTTRTTHPEEEQVYYQWFWGDGNFSSWLGPYASGETASASHTWTTKNNYNIRVRAKDQYGQESGWSDPLSVNVPRIRISNHLLLQFLLEKINYIFSTLLKLS